MEVTVNPEYVVWVERLTNEKIASFIDTPVAFVKSIARAMSKEPAYKNETVVVGNFKFGMVSSYENGKCVWRKS